MEEINDAVKNVDNTGNTEREQSYEERQDVVYERLLRGLVPKDKEVRRADVDTIGGMMDYGFEIVPKDTRTFLEKAKGEIKDLLTPLSKIAENYDPIKTLALFDLELKAVQCSREICEEEWFKELISGVESRTDHKVKVVVMKKVKEEHGNS